MCNAQASYQSWDIQRRPLDLLSVYWRHAESSQGQQQGGTAPDAAPEHGRARPKFAPTGVGDCCSPKLLHAAALSGFVPLCLLEFWYGSPPSTNTPQGDAAQKRQRERGSARKRAPLIGLQRRHGAVYGPCPKCLAILGTMLCDAQ